MRKTYLILIMLLLCVSVVSAEKTILFEQFNYNVTFPIGQWERVYGNAVALNSLFWNSTSYSIYVKSADASTGSTPTYMSVALNSTITMNDNISLQFRINITNHDANGYVWLGLMNNISKAASTTSYNNNSMGVATDLGSNMIFGLCNSSGTAGCNAASNCNTLGTTHTNLTINITTNASTQIANMTVYSDTSTALCSKIINMTTHPNFSTDIIIIKKTATDDANTLEFTIDDVKIVNLTGSLEPPTLTNISINETYLGYGWAFNVTTIGATGTNYRLECGSSEGSNNTCVSGYAASGEIEMMCYNAINQTNGAVTDTYQTDGAHNFFCRLWDTARGYSISANQTLSTNTSKCDYPRYLAFTMFPNRNFAICPGYYSGAYSDQAGNGLIKSNINGAFGIDCQGAIFNNTGYVGGDGVTFATLGAGRLDYVRNCSIVNAVSGRTGLYIGYHNLAAGQIVRVYNNTIQTGASSTALLVGANVIGEVEIYNNSFFNAGTYSISYVSNWQKGNLTIHDNVPLPKTLRFYPNSANAYNLHVYNQNFSNTLELNTVDHQNGLNVTNCTFSFDGDAIVDTSYTYNSTMHSFYHNNFLNGNKVNLTGTVATFSYNYWGPCVDSDQNGFCDSARLASDGSNISDPCPYSSPYGWMNSTEVYANETLNGGTCYLITTSTSPPEITSGWFGYATDDYSHSWLISMYNNRVQLVEYQINITQLQTNWSLIKQQISDAYNYSMRVGLNIYMDFNYSNTTQVGNNSDILNATLKDLKVEPYLATTLYIQLESDPAQNATAIYNLYGSTIINSVNTNNKFPVYCKNDCGYVTNTTINPTIMYYNNETSAELLIDRCAALMRNSTNTNRIYSGNEDTTLLGIAYDINKNIYRKLRGSVTATQTLLYENVAELSNKDIIIFNNQSGESTYEIDFTNVSSGLHDWWDETNGILLANDFNGTLPTVTVPAYSAIMIFRTNLDRLEMTSSTSATAYYTSSTGQKGFNYTDNIVINANNFGISAANRVKINLYDPKFTAINPVIVYYGWLNSTTVDFTLWSNNFGVNESILVIADKNPDEIQKLPLTRTHTCGYISVASYAEDNATWVDGMADEADAWFNLNVSCIFFDGLDYGTVSNQTDFNAKMTLLHTYVATNKSKNDIFNTYTYSEMFCHLSTLGCMKESCIGKWNGSDSSNVTQYYYEDFALDRQKADWYEGHGIDSICMIFMNSTESTGTYENYYDAYMGGKVLGHKYWYIAQPDFQTAYVYYMPNVSTKVYNDYSNTSDLYSRLYTNGMIYYNSTSHEGYIDDGRSINYLQFWFRLYGAQNNDLNISLNNGQCNFTIANSVAFQENGTWQNYTAPAACYSYDGQYKLQIWSDDGLNVYRRDYANTSHSWYSTDSGATWTRLAGNENWIVHMELNDSSSGSLDTTDKITQTNNETSFTYGNKALITLTSDYDYNISIITLGTNLTIPRFQNMSIWGAGTCSGSPTCATGTCGYVSRCATGCSRVVVGCSGGKARCMISTPCASLTSEASCEAVMGCTWSQEEFAANFTNSSDCTTTSPTWNYTTILVGGVNTSVWGLCQWDYGNNIRYVKAKVPHLSSQTFYGEGENSPPTITNVQVYPGNGLADYNYSCIGTYADVDGDTESGSTYIWYVNGADYGDYTKNITPSAYVNYLLTCEYTPGDSYEYGTAVASTNDVYLYTITDIPVINSPSDAAILPNPLAFNGTCLLNSTATLFINDISNQSISVLNATTFKFNKTLADGNYNWTIQCCETVLNQCANATVRTLTVDSTPPAISYLLGNWTIFRNNRPTFNYTYTDFTNGNCDITITNSSMAEMQYGTEAVSAPTTTVFDLSTYTFYDGIYGLRINCTDAAGNSNTTLKYNFTTFVTCLTPFDDLPINDSTTLCNGTYFITDAGATGVVLINSSNLVLTFNDTKIVGTNAGTGIINNMFNNITIMNSKLNNYSVCSRTLNSTSITLQNTTLDQCNSATTTGAIHMIEVRDANIYNTSSIASRVHMYITDSNDIDIQNTSMQSIRYQTSQVGIYLVNNTNNTIINRTYAEYITNTFNQAIITGSAPTKLQYNLTIDYLTAYNIQTNAISTGKNITNLNIYNTLINESLNTKNGLSIKGDNVNIINFNCTGIGNLCLNMNEGSHQKLENIRVDGVWVGFISAATIYDNLSVRNTYVKNISDYCFKSLGVSRLNTLIENMTCYGQDNAGDLIEGGATNLTVINTTGFNLTTIIGSGVYVGMNFTWNDIHNISGGGAKINLASGSNNNSFMFNVFNASTASTGTLFSFSDTNITTRFNDIVNLNAMTAWGTSATGYAKNFYNNYYGTTTNATIAGKFSNVATDFNLEPILSNTWHTANVTVTSPLNNTEYIVTVTMVNFSVRVIDFDYISNVTLYINGKANQTNLTSGGEERTYLFNTTFGHEGIFYYNWTIGVCDRKGDCMNSSQYTFHIAVPEVPSGGGGGGGGTNNPPNTDPGTGDCLIGFKKDSGGNCVPIETIPVNESKKEFNVSKDRLGTFVDTVWHWGYILWPKNPVIGIFILLFLILIVYRTYDSLMATREYKAKKKISKKEEEEKYNRMKGATR